MSDYKYGLKPTTKFKKDYKLAKKRGLDMRLLEYVIDELLLGHTLDAKYLDHPLHGIMKDLMNVIYNRIGC